MRRNRQHLGLGQHNSAERDCSPRPVSADIVYDRPCPPCQPDTVAKRVSNRNFLPGHRIEGINFRDPPECWSLWDQVQKHIKTFNGQRFWSGDRAGKYLTVCTIRFVRVHQSVTSRRNVVNATPPSSPAASSPSSFMDKTFTISGEFEPKIRYTRLQ